MLDFQNSAFKWTSQNFAKNFGHMLGRPAPLCFIWSGAAGIGEHCVHMEQGKKTSTERAKARPFGPMQAGRPHCAVHVPSPPKVTLPPASLGIRAPVWLVLCRGGSDRPTPGRPAWPWRPAIKVGECSVPRCTRSSGSNAPARAP